MQRRIKKSTIPTDVQVFAETIKKKNPMYAMLSESKIVELFFFKGVQSSTSELNLEIEEGTIAHAPNPLYRFLTANIPILSSNLQSGAISGS